ncbi:hypothetical protein BGZ76_009856 [Entomortierella beljakovae]|nr:hypothetical protein BGZ76_009856 [Entomortierella beljakovae]
MDLQDELLACLLTVSIQEKLRLLRLTLESPKLSAKTLTDLFIWTVDFMSSKDCRGNTEHGGDDRVKALAAQWGSLVDEQESFPKAIDFENDFEDTYQELQQEFERWNVFIPGFSLLLRQLDHPTNSLKRRRVENQGENLLAQKLYKRQQEDRLLGMKMDISNNTHGSIQLDDHRHAFTKICETIRRHQDVPENPLHYITRLSQIPTLSSNELEAFKGNTAWVELIIQARSAGWRSCVKLKIQFFAVFDESSICKDEKAPLFGSWDFWRINIEAQLTATLNQLVSTNSSANSFAIPSHTIESLTKISLLAPYQVITKIVGNAMVNRGQSDILLHVLVSLGQLPWLRASSTEMTLLVNVIHNIILPEHKSEEPISDLKPQHHNLAEFIIKSFKKTSRINQVLLDPIEFLCSCVYPLLVSMTEGAESPYFSSVSVILLKMYQSEFEAPGIEKNWLSHKIHEKILIQLLQLRTAKSSWTVDLMLDGSGSISDARDFHRRERGHFGELLEDVSKVSELLVSRLTEFVESGGIGRNLESNPISVGSIDLESQLIMSPFYIACRQLLGQNVDLPVLPKEIWPLCHNRLKTFSVKNVKSIGGGPQDENLTLALLIALDVGRMSDEVILDITQAISQGEIFDESEETCLSQALIPVIYRILSISSRLEGHRLLVQGIPTLINSWGGITDSSLYWDNIDGTLQSLLGQTWDTYTLYQYQTIEAGEGISRKPWNGFSSEEVVLAILNISEPLLRFALEPLAQKSSRISMQIYRRLAGYDVMVDYIGSLILSSIKFANIDWSSVLLDFLLFGFLNFCRLSSIVTNGHKNKHFRNRFTLPSTSSSSSSSSPNFLTLKSTCTKKWTEEYYKFMMKQSDGLDLQEQMARSKARDEFVLAAMNLSEEIARRQDVYYKLEDNSSNKSECEPSEGIAIDTSKPGRGGGGGKRGSRGNNRGKQGRGGTRGMGDRSSTSNEPYQDDDNVPTDKLNYGGMDDSTKAWLNSITNTPTDPSSSPSITSHQDESRSQLASTTLTAPPTPELIPTDKNTMSDSSIVMVDSENKEIVAQTTATKEMLSDEQINCLDLALTYLPPQEQQAVRSRLTRLLKKES